MTKYDYIVIGLQMILGGLLWMLWRRVSEVLNLREGVLIEMKKFVREETKKFIPQEVHVIMCENASYKVKEHITLEIKNMKNEIMEAIKNANGKKP